MYAAGIHSMLFSPRIPGSEWKNGVDQMSGIYYAMEWLVTHGMCTRVAMYYGDGGLGFEFIDDMGGMPTNNPGNGAFLVYKFPETPERDHEWYIMIQYSYGAVPFSGNPDWGKPSRIRGSINGDSGSNIGIQVAIALDSDGNSANPWNGTTVNDGTDTKGSGDGLDPVWMAPPGGRLWVWGQENTDPSGSYISLKQNCMPFVYQTSAVTGSEQKMSIISDANSIIFVLQLTGGGTRTINVFYAGPVIPADGLDQDINFVSFSVYNHGNTTLIPSNTTEFGSETTSPMGGVAAINDNVTKFVVDTRTTDINSTYFPSKMIPDTYYEFPIFLYSSKEGNRGCVGKASDFIGAIYGVPLESSLNWFTRAVFGSQTTNHWKFSFPWDNSSDPSSGWFKFGTEFPWV